MKGRPHGWWIILSGTTPTSFRARLREALVPTLVQLQRTQPDTSLKWFERNQIWESPDAARAALLAGRLPRRRTGRPRDWRPGGEHRDPRQRFALTRDQKRARFKSRQRTRGPAASKPPRRGKGPR